MRQHSLRTTYLIHKTLVENEEITALVPEEQIVLLLNVVDGVWPLVTIRRAGITPARGNKDFAGDNVTFNITVYSDKYDETIDIAEAIRYSLEGYDLQDEEVRLEDIRLISASEEWNDYCFEQSMTFGAEVLNPIE